MFEIYVEIIGLVVGTTKSCAYSNGKKYELFRVISKNVTTDPWVYFNCNANQEQPAYRLIKEIGLVENDKVLVRGKLQQKFVNEEYVEINPETYKKEIKIRQVCKNRIYVNSLTILEKYDAKENDYVGNLDNQPETKEITKQDVKIKATDNPFGDY